MVEVQITRLEYAHHLQTLGRLAMERYRRLLNQLSDKALQGVHRDVENAFGYEVVQAVHECIGTEQ